MPIYEYLCTKCRQHTEVMQRMSDPPLTKCPSCSGKLRKLVSNTSFVLKGGGWYKDGYATASSASRSESSSESSGKKSDTPSKKDQKKAEPVAA